MQKPYFLLLCSVTLYSSITDFFHDTAVFTKEIIRNQREVGALFSCSSFTAKELTNSLPKELADHTDTYYILEIGAGTGAVTHIIADILKNTSTHYIFDVVEINETMCKHLRLKFYDQPQVRIHCCSILDWNPHYTYNYIVSTLPHNSLPPTLVQGVVDQYQKLMSPNGTLSYIEYIGGAAATKLFMRSHRDDITRIQNLLQQLRQQYKCTTNKVFLNLFPTYVHHIQFK